MIYELGLLETEKFHFNLNFILTYNIHHSKAFDLINKSGNQGQFIS